MTVLTMPSSIIDPDQYQVTHITDHFDLVKYTRDRNLAAWQGQLSANDYVVREFVLGKCKVTLSKSDRLLVYHLSKKSDPDTPLLLIEILIRKSLKYVRRGDDVEAIPVLLGCIGAVFTYPENRGQGLAKIMVDKLVELVREVIGPDGFIFLYSEVGEYYAKLGFMLMPVDLIHIPMTSDQFEVDGVAEPIHYHQFAPVMDEYARQLDAKCRQRTAADGKMRVQVIPSADIVDWFHVRAKYISYKKFYEKPDLATKFDFLNLSYADINREFESIEPDTFGIKLSKNGVVTGFIVWTIDWINLSENYVTVLKTVVMPGQDVDSITIDLFKAMRNHLVSAHSVVGETKRLVVWELEVTTTVRDWFVLEWGAKTGLENGLRLAIMMCNATEDAALKNGQVVWEGNDKIPWF